MQISTTQKGNRIICYETLDSTQNEIKKLINENKYENFTIIWSKKQLQGRGRSNNTWTSFEGCFTFSFCYESNINESLLTYIVHKLHQTLISFGVQCIVKWPNDIYLGDKKIAGVLIDIEGNKIIIGIGINLRNSKDNFSSIEKITNIKIDEKEFIDSFLYNIKKFDQIQEIWRFPSFIHFEDNKYKFLKVENDYLHIMNENMDVIVLDPMKYSYCIKNNKILLRIG